MQKWRVIGRILVKTAVLFGLLNGAFAAARSEVVSDVLYPVSSSFSLYNRLYPGRDRLPYGEEPAQSYNLSLNSIPAMFASHKVSQPKAADEFRVILLGDSSVWGWLLPNETTLAGQLNEMGLTVAGRAIIVYNLGYPALSLSKDLLLLDEVIQNDPDLILWLVTLESFAQPKQLEHPILQHNSQRMRRLIEMYGLNLDGHDPRFVTPDFWQNSMIGQRRALADWLRLQQVGVAWAATGIDQAVPDDIPLRRADFEEDASWQTYREATLLAQGAAQEALAFDVLAAGIAHAGDVPLLLINEPIFVSTGQNSHLRYNLWYPRWAYDQYRALLAAEAAAHQWQYVDLWDVVPPDDFTDSPVHLTPAGTAVLAGHIKVLLTTVKH